MSNLLNLQAEDNFETRLSAKVATSDLTINVQTNVSFTFADPFYISVNPGLSNYEPMLVTGIAGTVWTVTRAQARYTGDAGSAKTHAAGAKVIISDNQAFFADVQTAVNSKVDKSGSTMTGPLDFSGTTNSGLRVNNLTTAERDALTPADGMIIYNTTTGIGEIYDGGSWNTIDTGSAVPNASTTVAGIVEEATDAEVGAGTAAGGTGAQLFVNPASVVKAAGSAAENKLVALTANADIDAGFIELATDGAVEDSTGLQVKVKSNSGITRDSNGLSLSSTNDFFEYPSVVFNELAANDTGSGTITIEGHWAQIATGASTSDKEQKYTTLPAQDTDSNNNLNWDDLSVGDVLTIEGRIQIDSTSNVEVVYGITTGAADFTNSNSDMMLVRWDSTDLKFETRVSGGGAAEETTITGVTLTNWNTFKMVITLGTDAKCYVNGSLEATHSTSIPTTSAAEEIAYGVAVKTTTTAAKTIRVGSDLYISYNR